MRRVFQESLRAIVESAGDIAAHMGKERQTLSKEALFEKSFVTTGLVHCGHKNKQQH